MDDEENRNDRSCRAEEQEYSERDNQQARDAEAGDSHDDFSRTAPLGQLADKLTDRVVAGTNRATKEDGTGPCDTRRDACCSKDSSCNAPHPCLLVALDCSRRSD